MPLLYNLKNILNNKMKALVFDALVTSQIRYGIEIYGFGPNHLIDRLQKTQNKLVKILFASKYKYKSAKTLFKEFQILTIYKLRDYVVITNNYFNDVFKVKDSRKVNYMREKTIRYYVPMIKNNFGMRCENYYVPRTFNALPDTLINLPTFHQVKRATKDWLINNHDT
jgi:hypothetical protein